jgi:hypothetical protein
MNGGSSTRSSTPARSLKLRSSEEVASVKLVGGTDLGRGMSRQMEHDHDGRHESRSELSSLDEPWRSVSC